jgi:UDP-2-acetamido-3-amino-2,3-dideoxy-glucuronate N-acetyltransferase
MSIFTHELSNVQSTKIGAGTKKWQYVVVLENAEIGKHCKICSHCLIENKIVIGN